MPGIDGAALAAAVKPTPLLSDVVYIMLTSVGHWKEHSLLRGQSIDACLLKPVRHTRLMTTLATEWAKRDHGRRRVSSRGARRVGAPPRAGALASLSRPRAGRRRQSA